MWWRLICGQTFSLWEICHIIVLFRYARFLCYLLRSRAFLYLSVFISSSVEWGIVLLVCARIAHNCNFSCPWRGVAKKTTASQVSWAIWHIIPGLTDIFLVCCFHSFRMLPVDDTVHFKKAFEELLDTILRGKFIDLPHPWRNWNLWPMEVRLLMD